MDLSLTAEEVQRAKIYWDEQGQGAAGLFERANSGLLRAGRL